MKRLALALGWISALPVAGRVAAEEPSSSRETATIFILAFENSTGRTELDPLAGAAADLVAAFLVSGSGGVRVVDRRALETIYAEKSLSWQGLVADGSKLRSDVLSRANYVLRGSLRQGDRSAGGAENVEAQAFLHETSSTRLVKSFEARGAPGEIVKLCRELAADVSAFFQEDLAPMDDLPADDDPRKSLLVIHGLSAFHNGAPHRAMACFLKVLETHPDDEAARLWLARSFLGAGFGDHAKLELEEFLKRFPESDRAASAKRLLESLQRKEGPDNVAE